MSTLLENLTELVKMIFACIVTPNYAASNQNFSLLRHLFVLTSSENYVMVRNVLLLTFGIGLAGVSIGILKRFLWKN